jgi:hypothetical protein
MARIMIFLLKIYNGYIKKSKTFLLYLISNFILMNLYREEDIQAITDNLDRIVDDVQAVRNEKMKPTMTEYQNAMKVIRDFIKRKKRIVYGGDAYNKLIHAKEPADMIYKVDDRKDTEFYSPEPIEDLYELCSILYDAGFPWVQGRQAQHNATYSLFVNFENLCDTTYMPRNVYSNMPVIKLDGMLYSDTIWMMVDVLRQHNDPMSSYQRVKDKTFNRANVLFRHYPLKLDTKQKFKYTNVQLDKRTQLFAQLLTMEDIVFTGSIANHYYSTLTREMDLTSIEIFSADFDTDVKHIVKKLKTIFLNQLLIKSRQKQFLS